MMYSMRPNKQIPFWVIIFVGWWAWACFQVSTHSSYFSATASHVLQCRSRTGLVSAACRRWTWSSLGRWNIARQFHPSSCSLGPRWQIAARAPGHFSWQWAQQVESWRARLGSARPAIPINCESSPLMSSCSIAQCNQPAYSMCAQAASLWNSLRHPAKRPRQRYYQRDGLSLLLQGKWLGYNFCHTSFAC